MTIAARMAWINARTQPLERFAPLLALVTRLYVSWVFLKSGWLKLSDWDSTQFLFREEYRVPLLPPDLAAVVGTAGELLFPLLLIFGICGRLSALGLQAVNVLAVVSYSHVLLQEGFEAAIAQHYLWGFMLLVLMVYGPGRWSMDGVVSDHRFATVARE
ncbi:putative oxidoreductase [Povalibacter uvarum]|uniref:Putative oxidoreductase n=1 Tax=Povalibacter uvarum TaxID=732238 RepID=A0A841HMV5_9GAMM|nr:DoxX family protein [Povalibacter uvarum]MBB6093285.1 putative oxidoreductase [Povalibacter uvarum]